MTLRHKIQAIITNNKDNPEQAAFLICEMLENEIGLEGNGWFEDDPGMLGYLAATYPQD